MVAKSVSAVNRRSKRSRSNESTDTATKVHRAELLHKKLLAKHTGMPMKALWEALIDKTLGPEVAMAIVNDPSCGIERRSAIADGEIKNPAFDFTLAAGATPLMLATLAGRDDVMKALLSLNAAVDTNENHGFTALHISARTNNTLAIEMLVGGGSNLNATDNGGWTPLHRAVHNQKLEAVKLLIAKGSHANATANGGWTPLTMAAETDNFEIVRLLIDSGSCVNADMECDWTPLHMAARRDSIEAVKLLIDSGSEFNYYTSQFPYRGTPLHVSTKPEARKLLRAEGAIQAASDLDLE